MSASSNSAVQAQLPVSFDTLELIQADLQVLVLLINAGILEKDCVEGRVDVSDLIEAGILDEVIETAEDHGTDIRELRGNYWGSSPEQRIASPRAQRLMRHIREWKKNHSDGVCACFEECEWCQEVCR